MACALARKLIESHLVDGKTEPGEDIGLRINQTLTQNATGTLVMLKLDAMGIDRVQTQLSAQYVDHNLLQVDFRNPDDPSVSAQCEPSLRHLVQRPRNRSQPIPYT